MSEALSATPTLPGARVRAFRARSKLSLNELADKLKEAGCERPSEAKLSRIETGVQPIPTDILPALSEITGISVAQLRPDLAELFGAGEVAQ